MEKVQFEGKVFTLLQQPYIDGLADEEPIFKALAVDDDGNEYEAEWKVVDNWEEVVENGDYQELVEDWSLPSNLTKI